jgi:hypothetical protein
MEVADYRVLTTMKCDVEDKVLFCKANKGATGHQTATLTWQLGRKWSYRRRIACTCGEMARLDARILALKKNQQICTKISARKLSESRN